MVIGKGTTGPGGGQGRRERPLAFMPGELLVAVTVPNEVNDQPEELAQRIQRATSRALGNSGLRVGLPRSEARARPIAFPSSRAGTLAFVALTLGNPRLRAVRDAVLRLNGPDGQSAYRAEGLDSAGTMPNWFSAAQQSCFGGSPASRPTPVTPGGGRVRYEPQGDFGRPEGGEGDRVQVAVLDTAPKWDLSERAAAFPDNRQLAELLGRLGTPASTPATAALDAALAEIDVPGHFGSADLAEPFSVADHGLFVVSVVHAVAPWVGLRLVRVLNDYGIGTMETVLLGLATVFAEKASGAPLIVNLSLGMLPPLEQLPAIWYGLSIPGMPDVPPDPDLHVAGRDEAGLRTHSAAVEEEMKLLHAPVARLMDTLLQNNCLVVAAAGNDSAFHAGPRRPRWQPRIPASYDTVVGVAATGEDPKHAAAYSNIGDLPGTDAVATLGGDLAADGTDPLGGVVGVYTATAFPDGEPNTTGWAEWSGTSFATPIVAGIAANLWAAGSHPDAGTLQQEVNAAARSGGAAAVPDLRVPAIPVKREWLA